MWRQDRDRPSPRAARPRAGHARDPGDELDSSGSAEQRARASGCWSPIAPPSISPPLVTMVGFASQWGEELPLSWLMGADFAFGLIGISVCRMVLFAVEAAIVAALWHNGLWIGGAINHSGSAIISTAR